MEININLQNEDILPYTYGGEDNTNETYSYYGLQFDDLTISLTPKQALHLCIKLKEHLELNGHKIK